MTIAPQKHLLTKSLRLNPVGRLGQGLVEGILPHSFCLVSGITMGIESKRYRVRSLNSDGVVPTAILKAF